MKLTRESTFEEINAAARYDFRENAVGPFWQGGDGPLAILLDGYFSRDDLAAVLRVMDAVERPYAPAVELTLAERLRREQGIIAASRDRLRELLGDVSAMLDSSTAGVEDLSVAIDRLSEYV